MANYLDALERGYVGSNPFHNNVHAADVMFTLNYFLGRPLFREMVGPLDKFGALLAALAHDFAHPGVSNAFLMTTRSEEAVLYNDQSVLEMFHAAGSWRLLLTSSECNVTEGFTPEMYKQMRETHIAMILATDLKVHCRAILRNSAQFCATLSDAVLPSLKVHFEHLGRLKTRIATDAFVSVERKEVLFLLGQALHAADISSGEEPAMPPDRSGRCRAGGGSSCRARRERHGVGLPASPRSCRQKPPARSAAFVSARRALYAVASSSWGTRGRRHRRCGSSALGVGDGRQQALRRVGSVARAGALIRNYHGQQRQS